MIPTRFETRRGLALPNPSPCTVAVNISILHFLSLVTNTLTTAIFWQDRVALEDRKRAELTATWPVFWLMLKLSLLLPLADLSLLFTVSWPEQPEMNFTAVRRKKKQYIQSPQHLQTELPVSFMQQEPGSSKPCFPTPPLVALHTAWDQQEIVQPWQREADLKTEKRDPSARWGAPSLSKLREGRN